MDKKKEAIPFITIIQNNNNDKQTANFTLNPKAIEVFNLPILKGKKLAIVSIAGPQRTGKSFLANRLLKRMDGFAIGPSTIPCTKGIWIWSEPIRVNQDTYMIIIDTEGLNSVQRDINIDIKIFSLSILLSSVFIYNSIGHIDEKALENMSLVLNLSNSICLKKGSQDQGQIAKYFPYFYWVLRDFSLDLKSKTEKQYLEECLSPYNNNEKDPKNIIRSKIRKFFPYRRCECFPRPLNDESKLAHIQEQKFEDLRPVFIDKMKTFERQFFNNLPVKIINGKAISSEMFIGLTYQYLQAINNGGVPEILTSLERVISTESRKVYQQLQSMYIQAMGKFMQEQKLPFDEIDIQTNHKHFVFAVNEKFDEKLKSLVDPQKYKQLKKQLNNSLDSQFHAKLKYNNEKSELKCKELMAKFIATFKFPEIESIENITACLVQQQYEEYRKGIKQYFQKTKAPKKYTHYIDKFPKFIFDYFDKLIQKIKKIYNEEIIKIKVFTKQSQEQIDRIKKISKQQQTLLFQKNKEIEEIIHERDVLRRELDKISKINEIENESANTSVADMEKNIESKKKKINSLKDENTELSETVAKLKSELTAKKVQNMSLSRRVRELEQNTSSSNATEESAGQLISYLNDLKQKLVEMDEFYKRKLTETNPDQKKSREIDELRKQKLNASERMKNELKAKKQEYKNNMEKYKQNYQKRIEVLSKHLDDVKANNLELEKKLSNAPGSEQKLKKYITENKKLQEGLALRQNNITVLTNLVNQKDLELKALEDTVNRFKDMIALLNSEKANLISFKETFGFILRESLLWVLNKQNKLKHSVKTLNQEQLDIIKESFNSVGLHPF